MKQRIALIGILALGMASIARADEGAWRGRANMPTRRYVLQTSVVDGKVYAIGGDTGGGKPDVVEEYDPTTDQWTKKTSMPIPVGAGSSGTVDGKVYIIGGLSSQWSPPLSSVQVYDAVTDTWSTRSSMPTARGWLSASVVNGKVFAIGGASAFDGKGLSTVEQYDPATDAWTKKADMPTARACLSTSVVDGKIYAIGGTLNKPWSQATSIVEVYDPVMNTWVRKSDMTARRSYLSTIVLNERIYAVGGFSSGYAPLSSMEQYNTATDEWTAAINMPTPRWGLSTSVLNGKIYAIGGRTAQGSIFSTVEEYDTGLGVASPDFNGDEIVDMTDFSLLARRWHQEDSSMDTAPGPFGDGVVDHQDLAALSEYWLEEVLPDSLIAYWRLDETQGTSAMDSAGKHEGLVVGGAQWRPDEDALAFDGVNDYVYLPFVLNPSDSEFSVFMWIKGGGPGQVMMSQIDTSGPGRAWLCCDGAEGKLMTELQSSGRGGGVLISDAVVADGNWHRVGLVWDGSHRHLYVDGEEVAADAAPTAVDNLRSAMFIGVGGNLAQNSHFSGLIDDVRIYNQAVAP